MDLRTPRVVAAAAIVDDLDRPTLLLAARRTKPEALRGGWEFPGGKVERGESAAEAVCREVREELGVGLVLGSRVDGPEHGLWDLGRGRRLSLWWATVTGVPRPLQDHDQLRWLTAGTLHDVPWLPADLPPLAAVARRLLPG